MFGNPNNHKFSKRFLMKFRLGVYLKFVKSLGLSLSIFAGLFSAFSVHAVVYDSTYEIKVGWMRAGEMSTTLEIEADKYQLHGEIRTVGFFASLLRWQGDFSAVGTLVNGTPQTDVYLVIEREREKDERSSSKIVITDEESARIHRTGRKSKRVQHPSGDDLMSTLLMLTSCESTLLVHDGEDTYVVNLVKPAKVTQINQGKAHYSGPSELCRYQLMYEGRQLRKVDVWLADVLGRTMPVRIRVRIPILPDGLMKLRNPKT